MLSREEDERGLTDPDPVAVVEGGILKDLLVVHEHAVRAAVVAGNMATKPLFESDLKVLARDEAVHDLKGTGVLTPDRDQRSRQREVDALTRTIDDDQ